MDQIKTMKSNTKLFNTTSEMPYANSERTIVKANDICKKLKEYLSPIKKNESFSKGQMVYIPDLHGDFIHLIITLHKHGALNKDLNLVNDFRYVFLGDFYDRTPDADAIDYWLNNQIKNNIEIYRLLGNHEIAFFMRQENGHPLIFPSQDAIKDISNNFQITENLLYNIAEGNILAAYSEPTHLLYVHSYVINDDFKLLGLEPNTDITTFAIKLNERLKQRGQEAYDVFFHGKKQGNLNWKEIFKPFEDDLLFSIHNKKDDIHTSFLWRRTGLPMLKTYQSEIDTDIPDDVYQIIGHTPVFSFNLPQSQSTHEPFVISSKTNNGKVQFSDVGIGYFYKSNGLERPEVTIKASL